MSAASRAPTERPRPRLLDLFCGAGGCAKGYQRAGFYVVGVDVKPQPNYCGDEFIQDDALEVLREHHGITFDAIHASPPCQAFTAYKRTGNVGDYPDLIAPVRELLEATGLPYVIENVEGAPLKRWVKFCGSMLDPTPDVQRHRLFETNWGLQPPMYQCRHWLWEPDRYPGGRSVERTGSSRGLVRATIEVGSWDVPLAVQQQHMGIDWTTLEELSEAIPPAYTFEVGRQLIATLTSRADCSVVGAPGSAGSPRSSE